MQPKTLKKAWLDFKNENIPKDVGSDQLKDMEILFYFGALASTIIISKAVQDKAPEPVKALLDELESFEKNVKSV